MQWIENKQAPRLTCTLAPANNAPPAHSCAYVHQPETHTLSVSTHSTAFARNIAWCLLICDKGRHLARLSVPWLPPQIVAEPATKQNGTAIATQQHSSSKHRPSHTPPGLDNKHPATESHTGGDHQQTKGVGPNCPPKTRNDKTPTSIPSLLPLCALQTPNYVHVYTQPHHATAASLTVQTSNTRQTPAVFPDRSQPTMHHAHAHRQANPTSQTPYFPLPRPFPAAPPLAPPPAAAGGAPGVPLLLLRLARWVAATAMALPALVAAATLLPPPPCRAPGAAAAAAAAAAFGLLLLLRGCGDVPRPRVRPAAAPAAAVGDTNAASGTASVICDALRRRIAGPAASLPPAAAAVGVAAAAAAAFCSPGAAAAFCRDFSAPAAAGADDGAAAAAGPPTAAAAGVPEEFLRARPDGRPAAPPAAAATGPFDTCCCCCCCRWPADACCTGCGMLPLLLRVMPAAEPPAAVDAAREGLPAAATPAPAGVVAAAPAAFSCTGAPPPAARCGPLPFTCCCCCCRSFSARPSLGLTRLVLPGAVAAAAPSTAFG